VPARLLPRSVTANLARAACSRPIDPARLHREDRQFRRARGFPIGRAINAQALCGTPHPARLTGGSRPRSALGLFGGQPLEGKQYSPHPRTVRRIAHIVSDAIYGGDREKGYFDIPSCSPTRPARKERRVKRLALMDQTVRNTRYLTRGDNWS